MNAIGVGAAIGAVVAVVLGFGCWFYLAYHMIASGTAYWRSIPGTSRFRTFFWPKIHGIEPENLSTKYLHHRNRMRRGIALFFMAWLLAMAFMLIGGLAGGWQTQGANSQQSSTKSD